MRKAPEWNSMFTLLDLPYITPDLPGTGGRIREFCEDFCVEEVLAYEPSGEGNHLFINLTRKGMSTREVAKRIAGTLDLPMNAVGYAGLKDKRSVSNQTFSVHLEGVDRERLKEYMELMGALHSLEIKWSAFHQRKIRVGHLIENRFTINITDLKIHSSEALIRARKTSHQLREGGLPNFYGPQRVDSTNVRRGRDLLKGLRKIRNRWLKRFLVTSYIDHLCNIYLVERFERGAFNELMEGDIAKKYSTGGMFLVEDVEAEQPRYENHEISFTAPIYGPKMWQAEGPSRRLEEEILNSSGVTLEELARFKVRGSRRLGRLLPDVTVVEIRRGIQLRFSLPKGAYATIILREIMKESVA